MGVDRDDRCGDGYCDGDDEEEGGHAVKSDVVVVYVVAKWWGRGDDDGVDPSGVHSAIGWSAIL